MSTVRNTIIVKPEVPKMTNFYHNSSVPATVRYGASINIEGVAGNKKQRIRDLIVNNFMKKQIQESNGKIDGVRKEKITC